jgi:hypothetical protein
MYKTRVYAAMLLAAAFTLTSHAQSGTYTCSNFQFMPPNTQYPNDGVSPNALNDRDVVVGSFDGFDQEFAFTYLPNGKVSLSIPPGSEQTSYNGINDFGSIVGWWAESYENGSPGHGFVLVPGSTSTNIVHPDAQRTWATGINNLGKIVGYYIPEAGGATYGYVLSGGQFTDFYVPQGQPYTTQPSAINDAGIIVGTFTDFNPFGFIFKDGNFTLEYGPPNTGELFFSGINDQNDIVGAYLTNTGSAPFTGFVYSRGIYYTVQIPNATGTYTLVNGINNRGDITGQVALTDGTYPVFLGTGCQF